MKLPCSATSGNFYIQPLEHYSNVQQIFLFHRTELYNMIYVLVLFVGNNLISSKKFLPTAALWSISFDSQAVVDVYHYIHVTYSKSISVIVRTISCFFLCDYGHIML